MKPDSDAIFDSAHKLRVGRIGRRREVARARFAVDGEQTAQGQLQTTAVAPRADCVGKSCRLGAAFHPNPTEGVGHKALAKPCVHRSQH
jgi:hypothetical protein